MNGRQCRPWSNCSSGAVWSGSTLFAEAGLSIYRLNMIVINTCHFVFFCSCFFLAFIPCNSNIWQYSLTYWVYSKTWIWVYGLKFGTGHIKGGLFGIDWQQRLISADRFRDCSDMEAQSTIEGIINLTLVLLNLDIPCLSKHCRSRSVGFWRSQLTWIHYVGHSVCEYKATIWI